MLVALGTGRRRPFSLVYDVEPPFVLIKKVGRSRYSVMTASGRWGPPVAGRAQHHTEQCLCSIS
jgi:hypothetical protein